MQSLFFLEYIEFKFNLKSMQKSTNIHIYQINIIKLVMEYNFIVNLFENIIVDTVFYKLESNFKKV
jgi:hypothetical protein